MGYEQIDVRIDDGVMVLTLDRPAQLNAWTAQMGQEIGHALRAADGDDDVRVVVLTGSGRAFCAGADLSAGGDTFDADSGGSQDGAGGNLTVPWQIRKPVIAAINGHAVGVGITLPLCADVRYVAEEAKVQFVFVRRGVLPELASHVLLARVAGVAVAADLLLSGRMITGREAAELGIANRALPAAEVLPAAMRWARDVAANTAPASVALAKQIMWADVAPALRTTSKRETAPFNWLGRQADAREGIESFLEKRAPQWTLRVSELPEFPMG